MRITSAPPASAGAQREPTGAMPHDLSHDDAVVAVSGAVQAVNRLGGNVQSGGVAESGVGHGHVVVNRLRQRNHMDPCAVEAQGVLRSAASAQADHAIDSPLLEIAPDNTGHVLGSAVHHHAMRLVAAGAENRAADGENAGKSSAVQIDSPVLDQATKAIAKTDDLPPVVTKRGFADASDGSVQARAVAAGRENPDALNFCGHEKQIWTSGGVFVEPGRCCFELHVRSCFRASVKSSYPRLELAKVHRMQFGRKSEQLQQQIEQLELRMEVGNLPEVQPSV